MASDVSSEFPGLNLLPFGVVVIRADGPLEDADQYFVEWANDAAKERDPRMAENVGRALTEAYPKSEAFGFHQIYATALETGQSRKIDLQYADEQTERGTWRVNIQPNGRRVIVIYERIDEELERRARDEVQDRFEAVGHVVGHITHELKSVLGAIILTASAVGARVPRGTEEHEDLVAIDELAKRAADRVAQLADLSHQRPLNPQPIKLDRALLNITGDLRAVLGDEIKLQLELEEVPAISLDVRTLNLCMMSLARNAKAAMPDGGELTFTVGVTTREGGARVIELAARDTGQGMDAPTRARAFDPFFSTWNDAPAAGLGLALVRRTAIQAGGEVDALASDSGAHIVLRLPVTEPIKSPRVVRPANAARVLLVEDEGLLRRATANRLRAMGFEVEARKSAAEALAVLAETAVDVVVTDVVMPEMRGPELAAAIRTTQPNLPIVFTSGYVARDRASIALNEILVPKPFTPEDLEVAIRGALESSAT